MSEATPGYVICREGERRDFAGGGVQEWKALSAQTGGAFHAFVDELTRGKQTPLHMHPSADDSMYVISGEILYHVGGEEHHLGAGSFVTALRGTPHAFMVLSDTARVFVFQTPGIGEAFYLDASEPHDETGSDPLDIPRLQRAAEVHHTAVNFLGPPPFTVPA